MSGANVVAFLTLFGDDPQLLGRLKTKSKAEVIGAAAEMGLPFTDTEFNETIWELERRLAETLGETFDSDFRLWRLLWGRYYLEFLAADLIPALRKAELVEVQAS